MITEKTQHWNLKYQIQDPVFHHVYGLNIENVEKDRSFELKVQSWQHSQTIPDRDCNHQQPVLCCIGSSLIVEITSSMNVARGPGIRYTTTKKIVSFSISSTTANISKTLGISITSMIFNLPP